MTPAAHARIPASPMSGRHRISGPELARHGAPLREALEEVCQSTPFRTSPKSREFLRYIVLHCLDGDTEVLKERLIGMALLGRDADYDTATDAGVRVRANDVRKRLNAYNESLNHTAKYCFGLPAGTYVPVFYCSSLQSFASIASPAEQTAPAPIPASAPGLCLYRLATPTLVALFVCVIFLRAESAQSDSFLLFWNHVLRDKQALLLLEPTHPRNSADNPVGESIPAPQDQLDIQALNFAAPLFDLAAQLHRSFTLVGTPAQAADGSLVYIGAVENPVGQPDSLSALPERTAAGLPTRFMVTGTAAGRRILDRQLPQSPGTGGALLTIINGPRLVVWIDGVDDDAIRMLVTRLCDRSSFPSGLAGSFEPYTVTQAVFVDSQHGEPAIVRMPLNEMLARHEAAP